MRLWPKPDLRNHISLSVNLALADHTPIRRVAVFTDCSKSSTQKSLFPVRRPSRCIGTSSNSTEIPIFPLPGSTQLWSELWRRPHCAFFSSLQTSTNPEMAVIAAIMTLAALSLENTVNPLRQPSPISTGKQGTNDGVCLVQTQPTQPTS